MKNLIVCIGNDLVGDDAVGYIVYQKLTKIYNENRTQIRFLGLGGINILDEIESSIYKLIVVDAVQFGAKIGTVHLKTWDKIKNKNSISVSAHSIGLTEAFSVAEILYPEKMPKELYLIGVEGTRFSELGSQASPEVLDAVDEVLEVIKKLVN